MQTNAMQTNVSGQLNDQWYKTTAGGFDLYASWKTAPCSQVTSTMLFWDAHLNSKHNKCSHPQTH